MKEVVYIGADEYEAVFPSFFYYGPRCLFGDSYRITKLTVGLPQAGDSFAEKKRFCPETVYPT